MSKLRMVILGALLAIGYVAAQALVPTNYTGLQWNEGTTTQQPTFCQAPGFYWDTTLNRLKLCDIGGHLNYSVIGSVASGSVALGTNAIASTACDTTAVGISASGVKSTDRLTVTANADISGVTGYVPSTNGILTVYTWPGTNTVNIKVCNSTSSSITPGAVTVNWGVSR